MPKFLNGMAASCSILNGMRSRPHFKFNFGTNLLDSAEIRVGRVLALICIFIIFVFYGNEASGFEVVLAAKAHASFSTNCISESEIAQEVQVFCVPTVRTAPYVLQKTSYVLWNFNLTFPMGVRVEPNGLLYSICFFVRRYGRKDFIYEEN
jgi:hypothetical protein